MQASIVVSPSGMNGMTSTAPMRGCSPSWTSMSISWIGGLDEALEGVAHRPVLAGDREHRAVVAGIARPVEQGHAADRGDRLGHPVDDIEPATFGHVRDRFDQHVLMLATRPGRPTRRPMHEPLRRLSNAVTPTPPVDRPAPPSVRPAQPRLRQAVDGRDDQPVRDADQPARDATGRRRRCSTRRRSRSPCSARSSSCRSSCSACRRAPGSIGCVVVRS